MYLLFVRCKAYELISMEAKWSKDARRGRGQAGRGKEDMTLLSVGHMWHNCVLGAFLLARKQLYCILALLSKLRCIRIKVRSFALRQ